MRLSVVAARAEGGVIGRGNGLPWRLPRDLARFKQLTLGKPVIMGRRTFESIGRPLPGRRNIVVTRNRAWRAAGVAAAADLDAALALARSACGAEGEAFVIGGAALYAEALPRAGRIHLTEVEAAVDGDVWFPPFDEADFREIERIHHPADEQNAHAMTFRTLERIPL